MARGDDSPFVGSMQVVDNMAAQPGHCGICRGTPTDADGTVIPCIDTGVDVNWGENLYICMPCARVIGILSGNEDMDVAVKIRADLEQAEKQIEDLTEERDVAQARIDRMIDGARAKKEAKQGKVKA